MKLTLSPKKQRVIDALRQGWVLHDLHGHSWLQNGAAREMVRLDTWRHLLRNGVLEPGPLTDPAASKIYRLTEAWR